MVKHYFSNLVKTFNLFRYVVLTGIIYFGTSNIHQYFNNDNSSKSFKIAEGKILYDSNCSRCHDIGMAGAPKLGDRKDWSDRIVDGEDVMFEKAIAGIVGKNGIMPPKGGSYSLTDDEVKKVVLYMISTINTSKGNASDG